ncbi:MAG: hypothetical protein QWI73_02955 [Alphaproteobacteria bacterium]|nr:hypothetical protein [Alphaproteobacteria bacterium]
MEIIEKTTETCKGKKLKPRGRPRIKGALREPNGRVSRAKHNSDELAIKIRAQKFNLSFDQAKNPRSQSWVGRLSFLGAGRGLSEPQYKAAEHYLKLYNNYRKAILSPAAHYDNETDQTYIKDDASYTQWAIKTTRKFELTNKVIEDAQAKYSSENLFAAIQYGVLENLELPHLLGALRISLNALHHHFFQNAYFPHMHNTPIKLGGKKSANLRLVLSRDNSFTPQTKSKAS